MRVVELKCCTAPQPLVQWNRVLCMNCGAEQPTLPEFEDQPKTENEQEGETNEQTEDVGDGVGELEEGSAESTGEGTPRKKAASKRGNA